MTQNNEFDRLNEVYSDGCATHVVKPSADKSTNEAYISDWQTNPEKHMKTGNKCVFVSDSQNIEDDILQNNTTISNNK